MEQRTAQNDSVAEYSSSDQHEEQFNIFKRAIETMATEQGSLSDDEDEEDERLDDVFALSFDQDQKSQEGGGSKLGGILRMLQSKVNSIAKEITSVKKVAAREERKRATFGQVPKKVKLAQSMVSDIKSIAQMGLKSQMVTMEQAMHIIQMLAQYKTENAKLKLRNRELEIKIKHMENANPGIGKKADELSRPEATPEEEVGKIHNGLSVSLDSDTDQDSEYTMDSQCLPPSANGKNLLEQIFALEAQETASKLGISQRSRPLKPLVPKQKHRQSVEEVKQSNKKGEMLEIIQEVEKDPSKTHAQVIKQVQEKKRERLENKQLMHLLTESMRKLNLGNHVDEEGYLVDRGSKACELPGIDPIQAKADKVQAVFKSVQDRFDVLDRLEQHGDLNDPAFLRQELQRSSFLLAHERVNNESLESKIKHLLQANRKSQRDQQNLSSEIQTLTQRLDQIQSRLYDIASESESD